MAWQTLPVDGRAGAAGNAAGARLVRRRAGLRRRDLHRRGGRRYTEAMSWLDEVKWDANGLVPAIAQEVGSNDVLMLAFMNREALAQHRRARRGGLLEPLARAPVEEGRGERQRPEGARAAPRLRQRRRAAQGRADRPAAGRADDRLPHRPALLLLPALRDGAWQTGRSGLERSRTHLQIAARWTNAPPGATTRWHGWRA